MKKRTISLMHKLHLYLGLVAALIVGIVGLSGAILSYEKELLRIFYPSSFEVNVQEKKLSMEKIVNGFLEQKPEAQIRMITLSTEPNESYVFRIASKTNRKGEKVYIDPYTAEILPEVNAAEFFKLVENLHRRLLLSEVGKQIVGASVLMLIVIVISGIVIYMPRIKRGFFSSFTFKTKTKGRAFLYSMHGALGMWVVPFYLVVSLSGLYWSYNWYNTALYALAGVEKPVKHKHQEQSKEKKRDQKNKPNKAQAKGKQDPAYAISKAFESFDVFVQHRYANVTLRMGAKDGAYTFIYVDRDPAHIYARNELVVKPKTMQLIKHERYDDKKMGAQLMGSMFALHSGEYFGWIGQLGMFLASLLMPLFGITGLMLYLKKKKKSKGMR